MYPGLRGFRYLNLELKEVEESATSGVMENSRQRSRNQASKGSRSRNTWRVEENRKGRMGLAPQKQGAGRVRRG